jgi:hypothetical protein
MDICDGRAWDGSQGRLLLHLSLLQIIFGEMPLGFVMWNNSIKLVG